MNIKHFAVIGMALLLLACKSEQPPHESPNYITFTEKTMTIGVVDNEEWFEIPITATHKMSEDCNIGVEVIASESSAVEDLHFVIESHTLKIKAGKQATSLRIKGIADAITPNIPLEVKLRLIVDDENMSNRNSSVISIQLQRCCPFDINNFEGYAVLTSTWSMQYMNTDSHLVHTHVDENEEGVIVIEDMFYEDYDIRVRLYDNDRLTPIAMLCGTQVVGSTGEAFGTIYGNGKLMIGSAPTEYISYYSTCENFLLLYSEMFVEEVGTVGYFGHILEWISDDEAERIMREGL